MKNIETILREAGIEVTEEQLAKIKPAVNENYKPIADYEKQKEKLDVTQKTLTETQEALKAFEGVDVDGFKKQIGDLQTKIADSEEALKKKDAEYAAQLAERDFTDMIEKAITKANGKNAKAIKALLDLETIRGSKNQSNDLDTALAALAAAEDSKMLFGAPEPEHLGKGSPIGEVKKTGQSETTTMNSAIAEHYGK